MTARAIVAPLVSGSTYRRGVHLLLGGVIVLPYALLGVAFAQLLRSDSPPALSLLLLAVAALIGGAPAFLTATRTLETVAARALLEVDLPDPLTDRPELEARLRSALWFAVHLVAGGVVGFAALAALPMALAFLAVQFGIGSEVLAGLELGPLDEDDPGWWSLLGLAMLLGLVYAVAGLGRLAAIMAPVLLGPSTAERIAALEAEADLLAERNRLARELHDSIGHALTVSTLQAAAAREVIDSDPEFVRRALHAVEETGRAAMAELDHVLGLLREGGPASRTRPRSLADLERLVAEARATGTEVTTTVTGELLAGLHPVVSREGYRIVQESLTNAARHAAGQPVTLRVVAADEQLTIEAVNPVTPVHGGPAPSSGGRGLAGMRERVTGLGGRMVAGREDGRWRVAVRLPTGGRRVR